MNQRLGLATPELIWPVDLQSIILEKTHALSQRVLQRGWLMGTAESCTGGGIAYACTALPGSSQWFVGSVVSYTNLLKMGLLDVPADAIASHGAVSTEVAAAMALGATDTLGCQLAVAVSGIAGPGGAVPGKPVGTVCFGWALVPPDGEPQVDTEICRFDGDRAAVRTQTILHAIGGCLARLP